MTESRIQSEIRLALGQRDDVMLFRINVGKFRPLHGPSDRVIQSAPNGTPDLLGVLKPALPPMLSQKIVRELTPLTFAEFMQWLGAECGRALAIEVKSQKGALRAEQRAFRKAWEARGGLYIVARCVDDVLSRIDQKEE
jgi:hypothetical protein